VTAAEQIKAAEMLMQYFPDDAHMKHVVKEGLAGIVGGGCPKEELKDLTEIMNELGYSLREIKDHRMAVGVYVAKRYRETRGVAPGKVSKYVAGAHRQVNAYLPSDYEDVKAWVEEVVGM
jgi:hypothetical protein